MVIVMMAMTMTVLVLKLQPLRRHLIADCFQIDTNSFIRNHHIVTVGNLRRDHERPLKLPARMTTDEPERNPSVSVKKVTLDQTRRWIHRCYGQRLSLLRQPTVGCGFIFTGDGGGFRLEFDV